METTDKNPRGVAAYDPWDRTPASQGQLDYIAEMTKRVAEHDWSHLDTTIASQVIDRLNSVRKAGNIKFEQF